MPRRPGKTPGRRCRFWSNPLSETELLEVGVVIGTHGLRGDIKVRLLGEASESLLSAGEIHLAPKGEERRRFEPVRAVRHKGNILLRLKGHEHIDKVEHLVGSQVFMRLEDLDELPEGEFYLHQYLGLQVVDSREGNLGTLEDYFTTAAHDVLVVKGPYGEVLIPAVEQMIADVDLEAGRMLVELPEGLVEKSDDL